MTSQTLRLDRTWALRSRQTELAEGIAKLFYRGTPGHVAEFGTMLGNTASALAIGIRLVDNVFSDKLRVQRSEGRVLHLFDSFEGLPVSNALEDINSPAVIDGSWAPGTCEGISPEQLRALCTENLETERVMIHEGWFKDTIPQLPDSARFALIHVDCDLYSSTMDVLDGLLSRGLLQPGAMIFFDDWDCNSSRPDLGERKAWSDAVEKYEVDFSISHPYSATGQVIIFHNCKTTRAN